MSARRSWAALVALPPRASEARPLIEHILAQVAAAGADELWVLWSQPPGASPWELCLPAGARRLTSDRPHQLSERARLVNRALPRVSSHWVCVLDAFTWLDFGRVGHALERCRGAAIGLVDELVWLDREETRRFVTSGAWPESPATRAKPVVPGKACYAVEREVLLALGGLSEAFVGPADEGVELFRRLKAFFGGIEQQHARGLSLWAPRSKPDRAARSDNLALGKRLAQAIADDPSHYLAHRLETSLPPQADVLRALVIDRAQRAAFRVTDPTPPVVRPRTLAGSIWGITALFNPAGFRSRRENFAAFREGLRAQGLPLLVVELALGQARHEVGPDDAERVIQLRGGDVMWQKERLLNVAVQALPPGCDKVVWLDADVLFERGDWVRACAALLERYVVVQPFARGVRLLAGELRRDPAALPVGAGDGEILHGMAWGVAAKGYGSLTRYLEHGHSGYAWAARRELLSTHGLYDRNIVGNADLNMARAMFAGDRYLALERLSPKARAHLCAWAERFHRDVQGSVGWLDGAVFHLWHGDRGDRRYIDRLALLREHDYDPEHDLAIEPGGALAWARHDPVLVQAMRAYFERRREDR